MTVTLALFAMLVLALLVTALACWPWWRRPAVAAPDREAVNVAVYRSRLEEIDAEAAGGVLDAESAAQIREEQAARLLADAGRDALPAPGRPRRPLWLLVLLLPVFAAVWYGLEDRWTLAQQIELARHDPVQGERWALERQLLTLRAQLQDRPEDAELWARLGRGQLNLGAPAAAAEAYARAIRLLPDQPDWWVGEGEALAAIHGQNLQGAPAERFDRALALAPDHGRALFFAGLAAAQAGAFERATQHWSRLAAQPDLPPALREVIREGLVQWGASQPPTAAPRLTLRLEIPPEHAARAAALPELLLFARAAGGPPMPLAVKRLSRPVFPVVLTLSDQDAMLPDLQLSSFERYEVVARLSSGGDVAARPGDLEGRVELARDAAGDTVRLLLDRVVPVP